MTVFDKEYTEFYISFETAYAKLMYYAMVKKECIQRYIYSKMVWQRMSVM